jgi:aarF domain-containing kinase
MAQRIMSKKRPVLKFFLGLAIADQTGLLPGQTRADLRAIGKGLTNALVAVPVLGACVYDYSTSLKTLTYPSEEYVEARKLCHERSAKKVLTLVQHCGGIYLKAG